MQPSGGHVLCSVGALLEALIFITHPSHAYSLWIQAEGKIAPGKVALLMPLIIQGKKGQYLPSRQLHLIAFFSLCNL